MSKKKLNNIIINDDATIIDKDYDLDSWWALLKIKLDELNRILTIFRRKKSYTDEDNSNIFNISALFNNYLSAVNIMKDKNELLINSEQFEEVLYYDEYWNIEDVEYITKNSQINLFTIKELIIEDWKLKEYKSRELEIAERERNLNIIKNLTVSINWVMTDNIRDLNKVLFQGIE